MARNQTLIVEQPAERVRRNSAAGRGWRALAVCTVLGAVLLSLCWRPGLRTVASALVEEDPLAPADVIVVSNATAVADAVESAALYQEGYAREIVLPGSVPEAHLAELQRLSIPYLAQTALLHAVLERSGVPASAIRTLPDRVDGTEMEVAAMVRFATQHQPHSVLVITAARPPPPRGRPRAPCVRPGGPCR